MHQDLPSVTVIIAARPDQAEIKAVNAARKLDYLAERLEIIVARGKQPSVQRNTALRAARGEWIYFLDDDSEPLPQNLRRAEQFFGNSQIKMVGGPNICPTDAPALEKVFAVVLASWLAFGPSRARYASVGQIRESGEKELILCNMLARREAMLECGGFNESLYPNEENALMDDLQKRGGKLIYDPQFIVYRRPRHSLQAFAKMLRTYGRGRAEQFREYPTLGSAPNFVPPLFLVYLATLVLVEAMTFVPRAQWIQTAYAVPLAIYGLAIILQTFVSALSSSLVRSLLAMPLLVASHLFYGFGFWCGLFTKLHRGADRPKIEVKLEILAK